MFTGLVTAVGEILDVRRLSQVNDYSVIVGVNPLWLSDVNVGDSVAVNGACMTVSTLTPNAPIDQVETKLAAFSFVISRESVQRTCGLIELAAKVHLEKSLRVQDFMGGHIVSGHVDGRAEIMELKPCGESLTFTLFIAQPLHKYCAIKGSICVHGVSLTINEVVDTSHPKKAMMGAIISINLIPHTLKNTHFSYMAAGDYVNIEIDMLARYVERMLSMTSFN